MPAMHVEAMSTPAGQYDCCIMALGYESRARFVAEKYKPLSKIRKAVGFGDGKVLAYGDNRNWYDANGYEISLVDDAEFREWATAIAQEAADLAGSSDMPARVLIDVSSFTRTRIACLIAAFADISVVKEVRVDFAYSVAEYIPPPVECSEIAVAEPVLQRFAGWSTEPDIPVAAVIGAGYEKDRAVGIVEYLEATDVWAWKPQGPDQRYAEDVSTANDSLWEGVNVGHTITYDVLKPFETFVRLESLCYGVMSEFRPVLVPFGPKIFAVASLLVALHWPDRVAVWRVSGGVREEPVDRKADGNVVFLRATFGCSRPAVGSIAKCAVEPHFAHTAD